MVVLRTPIVKMAFGMQTVVKERELIASKVILLLIYYNKSIVKS